MIVNHLRHLQRRYTLIAQKMRAMVEAAEAEDRSLSDEERTVWQGMSDELGPLKQRIEDAEQAERAAALYDSEAEREEHDRQLFEDRRRSESERESRPLTSLERARAMRAWGTRGATSEEDLRLADRAGIDIRADELEMRIDRGCSESGEVFQAPRTIDEARQQAMARRRVSQETRAQSVGTDADGGYTVPDEMMQALDVALLQFGGMRQASRILTTATGAALPIPTANDTAQKGVILDENAQVAAQDVTFAQLVLDAYKYSSKAVLVSAELMQDSSVNMPQFLGQALGERIGRITNDHFTTGTGTAQPKGVVTAAADSGVTAAAAAALTFAEILSLKHSVDPAYRQNGIFMSNDTTVRIMKSIADSTGRPIWLPSLVPGAPDTFDGSPYVVNQSMASGTTAKALLYGDFNYYLIREVRSITLLRLRERYADYHQEGFFAFARYDGDLLNAGTNPIKYLTMG